MENRGSINRSMVFDCKWILILKHVNGYNSFIFIPHLFFIFKNLLQRSSIEPLPCKGFEKHRQV